jgi:hypothetical protein
MHRSGTPLGCVRTPAGCRWYRFAQPPATSLEASGFTDQQLFVSRCLISVPKPVNLEAKSGTKVSTPANFKALTQGAVKALRAKKRKAH